MIKSLIRRSTVLGMIGTAIVGSGLIHLKALALPAEQILQKLNPVPVFTIADEQGAPLVASGEDEAKVAGVFISQQDANNFVNRLQTQNPELASKVKVVPVSLGEVYKLAQDNPENNGLNFAYVPNEEAVNDAKSISGTQYEGGVPLFVAKGGEDNGYLTIERDSQQVIPFFFEKQQLENMVEKFKTQKPDLATSVNIEVVPLEGVIQTLQTNDDPMLSKIVLVPSTESLQFLQQNSTTPQPGTAPDTAPELQPETAPEPEQ
ncbi:Tic22 family protein [Hyella patelloides LEGE 07179]|uniref:Tic22 family protein n=1 Tax=Hyella patelloides LEGE 07179 TaxID=945734 RepID=A0A563VPZ2_9CYAN|nr:Tic22 family protein [Hyella patelloides]VEP13532.1 Tic22 family protein [Hyella patelloides LEGE 07179]